MKFRSRGVQAAGATALSIMMASPLGMGRWKRGAEIRRGRCSDATAVWLGPILPELRPEMGVQHVAHDGPRCRDDSESLERSRTN